MHNMRRKQGIERKPPKFVKTDDLEQRDRRRLDMILTRGFGVALSYGNMSRDRHYVYLKGNTTVKELLDFCQRKQKGEPLPGNNPVTDGPKLLALFKSAENAGIIRLEFVKAEAFTPEMK
jgi:hypothetical protein